MRCDECLHLVDVIRHHAEALRQIFDVFKTGRTFCIAAQRFADGFIELGGQGCFQHDHGRARRQMFACHLDAVRRVRIDRQVVFFMQVANRCNAIGVRRFAGYETELFNPLELVTIGTRLAGQVEAAVGFHFLEQRTHAIGVAAQQVKDEAFKVRRLADVHARAGGVIGLGRFAHAVNTGAEEFVEHVVFVGGDDQLSIGKPIMRAI
jgi:hypothetical protein